MMAKSPLLKIYFISCLGLVASLLAGFSEIAGSSTIVDWWAGNSPSVRVFIFFATSTLILTFVLFASNIPRIPTLVKSHRLPTYTRKSQSADLQRVDAVLNLLSLLLPSRIMKEDAGDAREVIDKLVERGAPAWMIYTKLASSVLWILFTALREILTVTKRKPN
jgi:hypothetical protein